MPKTPGVELENGYKNVVGQALENDIVQVKYFAERAGAVRTNINLEPDNRVESNHGTGRLKEWTL